MGSSDAGIIVPEFKPEREAILTELERILASSQFKNSKRYPSFLRYIVANTVEGRADQLKERILGVEVFRRSPDYDTNLDHIVRITAGEVRRRLAQYYYELGSRPDVQISLPAGGYVPEFCRGREIAAAAGTTPGEAIDPATARPKLHWVRYLGLGAACLLAVLAIKVVSWTSKNALDRFWEPVLSAPGPVLICMGPPNPADASDSSSDPLTASQDQTTVATQALRNLQMMRTQHVALADATTAARLAGTLERKGGAYHILSSPFTTLTDLRRSAVVLIGAFNNAWTLRFTKDLRFHFVYEDQTREARIVDRQNPSNRDWAVNVRSQVGNVTDDYAVVSRIIDPATEFPVVIVAGLGIFGTIAAGEFVANPHYMDEVARKGPAHWEQRNMEIVITTKVINGHSGPPRLLAAAFW